MKDAATSPTRYDPNDFTFSGKEVTFSELVVLEKSSKKDQKGGLFSINEEIEDSTVFLATIDNEDDQDNLVDRRPTSAGIEEELQDFSLKVPSLKTTPNRRTNYSTNCSSRKASHENVMDMLSRCLVGSYGKMRAYKSILQDTRRFSKPEV